MNDKAPQGLSRNEIIRKSREFRAVFRTGERRRTKHFNLYLAPNDGSARLGLTVSRKIGNAVVRNSLKRKLREFFRKHKSLISHRDLVVVARPGSGLLGSPEVHDEIFSALLNRPRSGGRRTRGQRN